MEGSITAAKKVTVPGVSVRPATSADVPFIDSLQKLHSRQVGWMPTQQLEGKIAAGQVLIAEGEREERRSRIEDSQEASALSSILHPLSSSSSPLGYVIAQDRYMKREDVGIIYQLNVAPSAQRGLVGATLVKAAFERAAYGCRLFCLWCAQDIEANRFWESIGFVPLAFRAGSRGKRRVHIFWQTRIREGDRETPWWFPSQTSGGSINEDRLVLPIPPGTHWSDAKPIVLPGAETPGRIEGPKPKSQRMPAAAAKPQPVPMTAPAPVRTLGAPRPVSATPPPPPVSSPAPANAGRVKAPRPKSKNDPHLVAAARELRDRWLEHVNAGGEGAASFETAGKYDVTRTLRGPAATMVAAIDTPRRADAPGLLPALPDVPARAA